MALLNPPSSTAVVDVPDAQVAAYMAQGWREVRPPEADRAKRTRKAPEK